MRKIKAFTLAEVLVTLTIIGAIAAITIPGLIQNLNDAHNKTAWKKTFSDLSIIADAIMDEHKGTLKGAFETTEEVRDSFISHSKILRSCDWDTSKGTCWHEDNNWYFLNGTPTNIFTTAGLQLANGAFMIFHLEDSSCSTVVSSTFNRCGWIRLDVNGFKGPNIVGKDIYAIHITANSLKPYGSLGDGEECIPSGDGLGCGNLYLRQ